MSEGAVLNACIRYLWMLGVYCWRNNSGAYKPEGSQRYIRYGTPGSADIVGVIGAGPNRGKIICVECKFGKNRQSDQQILFQDRIESHGGIYILAYSVDDIAARAAEIKGG